MAVVLTPCHRIADRIRIWQHGVYKYKLYIFTYMNADVCKEKSGDISLRTLCLFCFLFLIFYNMWLTVSEKISSARKFKKPGLCGLFLKAATKVLSPVMSVASISLLFIGAAKENLFLLFPWLVFVFKGILIIQSLNLLDLFQFFQEAGMGESGWQSYITYFVVIAVDMAECFCLRKIFEVFYKLCMSPKNEEKVEEKETENLQREVMKVMER